MAVPTMLLANLSPRLRGLLLRRPLGERRGLTFAGTFLVVEALFQFGDALHEFVDLAIAFAAPRAWPRVFVHEGKLAKRGSCSCGESYLFTDFWEIDR